MKDKLLQKMKKVVLENAGDDLVSLYVIGSFHSKEMIRTSDIDLVGVMKPSFNFKKEGEMNKALNKGNSSGNRIDLGTMSYDQFFGGRQQGSLMKHIELPVFLNFLKRAKLIYGRRINFNRLPIKPVSPLEELKYHIKVFNEYKSGYRKKNKIRPDFSFRGFIKIVFYIANLELQLTRNLTPRRSYSEIVKAFRKDKDHIVHYSMKLRRKKTISHDERNSWLDMAENYVAKMKAARVEA